MGEVKENEGAACSPPGGEDKLGRRNGFWCFEKERVKVSSSHPFCTASPAEQSSLAASQIWRCPRAEG